MRSYRQPRGVEHLSVADTWTDRLWETTLVSRYFGIVALALAAALVPGVGPHRLLIAALLLVVGLGYNLGLHRVYRIRHRPPSFLPYTDVGVALMFPPIEPRTLVPAMLLMLTSVALAATGIGRRQALLASILGVVGLCVIIVAFDLPAGLMEVVSFAIAAGMVITTVGAVAASERQVRTRFGSLVEGLDAIIWERDPLTHRYSFVTAGAEDILGYPRAAWLQDGFWRDHLHPDDHDRVRDESQEAILHGLDHQIEYRMLAADGRIVHLQDLISVSRDTAGKVMWSQGASIDVTERKRVEERVQQYADIVETIDIGLLVLRLEGNESAESLRLVANNPCATRATRRSLDHRIGDRLVDVFPALRGTSLPGRLADVVRTGKPFRLDHFVLRSALADEQIYALEAFPLPGDAVGVSLQDVTTTVTASATLRRQALHDGLTGLPNRWHLDELLRSALREAETSNKAVGLLMMDLDQFKEVNDALGHRLGDRLLVALARRLEDVLSGAALVARLGGDEFAVLLTEGVSELSAIETAERIARVLHAPFPIDELRLQTNASIGIALYPHHAGDAESLTQRADVAMYMAKRSGSGHAVYEAEQDRSSVRRLALIGDLRQAIEQNELVLHFQPLIALDTGRAVRAEALVRWQHPEHGLLHPNEFVELAELSGFIQPLTRWVLRRGVEMACRWWEEGHLVGLAVNLSVRNLYDPDLASHVAHVLSATGFPASELTLELTETQLMDDPVLALQVLSDLAQLGVRTSVDDFGTGYSSLTYLKDLPIGEIKIDRSFVADMHRRTDEFTIVRSMIDLGHNLGLQVVAEGVEHRADLDALRRLGCDHAQGYHFSRPLPMSGLLEWLVARDVLEPSAAHDRPLLD